MSHAFYQNHIPSSGVENSAKGTVTSSSDLNLIVSKANVLQLFKVVYNKDPPPSDPIAAKQYKKAYLELVLEKFLYGNIVSLSIIKLPRSKTDAIILSFKEAKVL